jgi:hypothetical protein
MKCCVELFHAITAAETVASKCVGKRELSCVRTKLQEARQWCQDFMEIEGVTPADLVPQDVCCPSGQCEETQAV